MEKHKKRQCIFRIISILIVIVSIVTMLFSDSKIEEKITVVTLITVICIACDSFLFEIKSVKLDDGYEGYFSKKSYVGKTRDKGKLEARINENLYKIRNTTRALFVCFSVFYIIIFIFVKLTDSQETVGIDSNKTFVSIRYKSDIVKDTLRIDVLPHYLTLHVNEYESKFENFIIIPDSNNVKKYKAEL